MSLLPGPATIVRYIRRYVITEYVITGLYCISLKINLKTTDVSWAIVG